jgi:hypothetical protein
VKNWPFLTSALDGGEWSSSRPSRFTRVKESRYLLRRLAGPRTQCGRTGEDKNILALPVSEPRTVQLVAWLIHRMRRPCFHTLPCSFLHECRTLMVTRRWLSVFERWLVLPSNKRSERDVVTLVYLSVMSDVHFAR